MLKINLLTEEKARRAPTAAAGGVSNLLLIGAVASVVLLLGGLFLFHASQAAQVDELRSQNTRVQSEIESIRSRVGDHQRIMNELAEIQRREDAIRELQSARTGPTAMLIEISRILSRGGTPTADPVVIDEIRNHRRDMLWNNNWEGHRLWLTEMVEENHALRISGEGRTPDDVGEFMRRLQLSLYFHDVRLDNTTAATSGGTTPVSVQRFVVTARVRY